MQQTTHPMNYVLENFHICAVLLGRADEEIVMAEEQLADMDGTEHDLRLDPCHYEQLAAISEGLHAMLDDLTAMAELCRRKAGVA